MPKSLWDAVPDTPAKSTGSLWDEVPDGKDATTGGIDIPQVGKPALPTGLSTDKPIPVGPTIQGIPRGFDPLNVRGFVKDTKDSGSQIGRGATAIAAAVPNGGKRVRPMPEGMGDTPGTFSSAAGGASDIFRGTLKATAPVTTPVAAAGVVAGGTAALPAIATGIATGYIGGKLLPAIGREFGAGEGTQRALEDVGTVGGGYVGAKYGPPAARAAVAKVKNTVLPRMDPNDAMVRGLKPRNTQINFPKDLDTSMPEVKAAEADLGRPIGGIDDLVEATNIAKAKLWKQVEAYSGPAAQRNSQIDMTPVADAMVQSIPSRTRIQNPGLATRIEAMANAYRKAYPIKDVEKLLLEANADLDAYYDKFPAAQRTARAANPDTAHTVAEANSIRKTLYDFLDQGTGAVREAKLRYGKLMDLAQTAQRRKIVMERQAPESLSQQVSKWTAGGKLIKGGMKMLRGDLAEGAQNIGEAWGESKIASALKERNSSDWLIKHAFEQYGKAPSPIPPPPPVNIRGAIGPGPLRMPGVADPSGTTFYGNAGFTGATNTGRRLLGKPTPGEKAPLITPPPADPSGPIPNVGPIPGRGMGLPTGGRLLPPSSQTQAPGYAVASPQPPRMDNMQNNISELVPWKNPTTGKIEYVPKWYTIPPRN